MFLALELLLDIGHHFCYFLHGPVFLSILALLFAADFLFALFTLHEDDAFVGLLSVFGVAFAIDKLELFFGRRGEMGRVGLAMGDCLDAFKLGFPHRNYIDFKSANSKSYLGQPAGYPKIIMKS